MLKNPTKCLWRGSPTVGLTSSSVRLPHLCAVTYMTEISLIVTLNNQFTYEMSMAWEPDRRSYFFFSPPAHLCAVTYMTEISLIVTLNNQFTYEMSMAWEPDRRSNFFFSPPAHLCAVTYMTEISLIGT